MRAREIKKSTLTHWPDGLSQWRYLPCEVAVRTRMRRDTQWEAGGKGKLHKFNYFTRSKEPTVAFSRYWKGLQFLKDTIFSFGKLYYWIDYSQSGPFDPYKSFGEFSKSVTLHSIYLIIFIVKIFLNIYV